MQRLEAGERRVFELWSGLAGTLNDVCINSVQIQGRCIYFVHVLPAMMHKNTSDVVSHLSVSGIFCHFQCF